MNEKRGAADPKARISVARNPRATYDYHLQEQWEAGIVLTGTEVKSLRNGEVWLEGMHITPYEQGNRWNPASPVRARKLLMHRREIERLIGGVEQKGFTLVPLELYFNRGRAKVALALARGKKNHDRREDIKRRIADREMCRALKSQR